MSAAFGCNLSIAVAGSRIERVASGNPSIEVLVASLNYHMTWGHGSSCPAHRVAIVLL